MRESLRSPTRRLLQWLGFDRRPPGLFIDAGAARPLFHEAPRLFQQTRLAFHKLLRKIRRGAQGGRARRRRGAVSNARVGRNIRVVPYRDGRNLLAIRPSVLRALQRGPSGRSADPGPVCGRARPRYLPRVRRSDLAGWDKVEQESLTLVLVVDVSRSSYPYMNLFVDLLRSLAGYFHRNRDRMGLISLRGMQAQVLNHPSHNYRVVTRNMGKLRIHGQSPLADGLLKALSMARLERFRNAGSRSLVVLLSDCFPEPVTGRHADLFDEPAYRAAILAAHQYRKEGTHLLVLNPVNPTGPGIGGSRETPGVRLARTIARVARGRCIPLSAAEGAGRVSARELDQVLSGIEAAYFSSRRGAYDPVSPGSGSRTVIE